MQQLRIIGLPKAHGWRLSPGQFLRFALAAQKPRKVSFEGEDRAIIYADAFFQPDGKIVKVADAEDVRWGQTAQQRSTTALALLSKAERVWYLVHQTFLFEVLEAAAQILPVLALKKRWPKQLLLFMDNEPSRRALVRGYGKDESVSKLMQVARRFFEEREFRPEWQRIRPSANISDKVRRFDFAFAERMGWTWLQHDWEAEFVDLRSAVEKGPLCTQVFP